MENKLAVAMSSMLSGMSFILNLKALAALFFLVLFVFVFGYLGIYDFLGLSIHNPLASTSYYVQPSVWQFVGGAILLVLMLLSFVYFAELAVLSSKFRSTNMKVVIKLSFQLYVNFLLSLFMQFLITMIGMVVFILPGIYLGTKMLFTGIIALDDNRRPFSSIMTSYSLTRKDFYTPLLLFLFYLIIYVVLVVLVHSLSSNIPALFVGEALVSGFVLISFLLSTDVLLTLERMESAQGQKPKDLNTLVK